MQDAYLNVDNPSILCLQPTERLVALCPTKRILDQRPRARSHTIWCMLREALEPTLTRVASSSAVARASEA